MQRRNVQKIIAVFLAAAALLFASPAAFAQDPEIAGAVNEVPVSSGNPENEQTVTARFLDLNTHKMVDLSVPYSDGFFERDNAIFYQDLARASFGLTVSAFRDGIDEGADADANIRSFFAQTGFEHVRTYGYDVAPTENSFACAIAEKKVGSATVVAFIGCGSGYSKEWVSNLTVGTGEDHEGFSGAADLCLERLTDYLTENSISGDVRLWTSGFSRASAVDNLLAGRLMETDLFSAVYGYFFATPNNTQTPIAYDNLFNIVGQNDPVSQLPLAAWGYGRNGRDIYTQAQESNSSFISAAQEANAVMHEVSDISFRNNPDLNRQLHVVFEYLGVIFPTADDYAASLQPQLISAFRNHGSSELLVLLREALSNVDHFHPEQQSAVNALMDYLDEIILQYVSGNELQKADGSWDSSMRLSCNIALEHIPATYLSWLFSADNPARLYTDATETVRLLIEGSFDLEVWDESGIVQSITSENEEKAYAPGGMRRPEGADLVYLYETNRDGVAVINLPCDREYTLRLSITESNTVSLFSERYSYGDANNVVSDVTLFSADQGDVIVLQNFLAPDGLQICDENGSTVLSVSHTIPSDVKSINARESLMKDNYTVRDLLTLAALLLILPLVLLLAAFLIFLCGRKKRKGKVAITVCFGLIALVYAAGAFQMSQILPNNPIFLLVLGALAVAFAGLTAFRIRKEDLP